MSERDFLGLLRCMRMVSATVNLKFSKKAPTQTILRQHSADSRLDQPLRSILTHLPRRCSAYSSGIAGMSVIQFGLRLGAGKLHPGCINDDYEVTRILIGSEIWTMFAAQNYGGTRGDTPERLALGVDKDPPSTTQCVLA
jgi:hypothetical protein